MPSRLRTLWAAHGWLFACALFALLLWRTAWVSDDAFITLRTIDNLWHGYGLRWNVAERVQTYTHPLWLLLLTLPVGLLGSGFHTALACSLLVSLAAIALVARTSRWPWTVLALLSLSPSFVDFCSSGLENPLTHLLLAALAACLQGELPPARRFLAVALLAGLASTNRLDTALLYLPALLATWPRLPARKTLGLLALGGLPLALWLGFALFYYGFALPNTAYAKTSWAHASLAERLDLGLGYLWTSVRADPVAPLLLVLALVVCARERTRAQLALCAAGLIYVGYAAWIGGDFMRGRFLSVPVLACALCLQRSAWLAPPLRRAACVGAGALLALLGTGAPVLAGAEYGAGRGIQELTTPQGVRDERALFFQHDSLLNAARSHPDRDPHPWSSQGRALRRAGKRDVLWVTAIGHLGYYAGPRLHFVDCWAIADPLLARLPPSYGTSGHYARGLPHGYLDSLRLDSNLIAHPGLSRYYEALRTLIRGPLLDGRRWSAWLQLNRGDLSGLLDDYAYLRGARVRFRVDLRNPNPSPLVVLSLWNEGQTALFAVDDRSQQGRSYQLTVELGAGGARVEGALPMGKPLARLAERGGLHISAVFGHEIGEPVDVYELRYRYRHERGKLAVHREPEGWVLRDFPGGPVAPENVNPVIAAQPIQSR